MRNLLSDPELDEDHDEVVTLVAVPSNPMPEDCCAEFGVGFIIVLGELEGHA